MSSSQSDDKSSAGDATLASNPSVDGGADPLSQAGAEGADLVELVPGAKLGQYEIVEKIGEGGMGLVFKATDTTLERTVALKVMYCEPHEDQRRAQRFIKEARAMARLSHPNLLHVYSVGSQANCHYFAMELLRGESLLHAIRRLGRIPAPDMMHYLVQIISALYYVHRNGIIHRDIKSSNIMLCGRRAVLMDFGLAKEGDDSGLTSVGTILGTPDYMPPEAAEGRTEGPPTDIYSLGVVLYEALSGRLPFMGRSAISIIRQHIDSKPPRIETLVPELKPEFAAIIHKCLAKAPADRYADCTELASALWDLIPEQVLLDVAEGRLPDAEAMSLEQTHFALSATRRKTGPNPNPDVTRVESVQGGLAPTLTGIQGMATPGVADAEQLAETMPESQAESIGRKGLPQWAWGAIGFAGVFFLVLALIVMNRPKPKAFSGQPVLHNKERDVLLEFKSNDPNPKNWYFVLRRKKADGSTEELKIPYRDYVPATEDLELHFLSDDAQKEQ